MKLIEYLEAGVRATELARSLGMEYSALVSQWAHGVRRVPAERCPDIERATGGQVTCEELRPDIDWAVLRGACPCAPHDKQEAA